MGENNDVSTEQSPLVKGAPVTPNGGPGQGARQAYDVKDIHASRHFHDMKSGSEEVSDIVLLISESIHGIVCLVNTE